MTDAVLHHPPVHSLSKIHTPSNILLLLQNLPITLTALINDTTGTLIASHYVNPSTKIACIFGTGCNAAYMEHVSDIEKIKDLAIDPAAEMGINCEWVGTVLSSTRIGFIDVDG